MHMHMHMYMYFKLVFLLYFTADGSGYGDEGYQGPRLTGPALWLTQAQGLLVKRAIYTYRRLLAYSMQTLLPLALIILGLWITRELQV